MSRILTIDEVTTVVMGFAPHTVSRMEKSFIDYRRGRRRIQVTDLW